ncbi:MAG: hypothetical protein IKZ89_08485, partial [Bacteroidaceae bacterium]|nr:hypothetical protein [Bacteroidaceae bacterium]
MRTRFFIAIIATALLLSTNSFALDFQGVTVPEIKENNFVLIENGVPVSITYDEADYEGVKIAVRNLRKDFGRVC